MPDTVDPGSVITVSKEKLLEASLLSLQTLGRQYQAFDGTVSLDTAMRTKTNIADNGMNFFWFRKRQDKGKGCFDELSRR